MYALCHGAPLYNKSCQQLAWHCDASSERQDFLISILHLVKMNNVVIFVCFPVEQFWIGWFLKLLITWQPHQDCLWRWASSQMRPSSPWPRSHWFPGNQQSMSLLLTANTVNIARGTTDPGHCTIQVALLALFTSSKFGHQMASFALVPTLATRWCHFHLLQIWPPDGATWISWKFSYQMAPWHYQLVLSWYLYQPESHQLSFKKVLYSLTNQTHRSDQETWVR